MASSGQETLPTLDGYDKGAHLSSEEISVDSVTNPRILKIRMKSSKTDPFRTGIDVYVG